MVEVKALNIKGFRGIEGVSDEDRRQKRNVTLMLLSVYIGRLFERCLRGKMLHGSS